MQLLAFDPKILFCVQAHRDLAREAVRRSLVLLKNGKEANNSIIPLPKKARKILVSGIHADNLGYQCGGWTINWQGFSGNDDTKGEEFWLITFYVYYKIDWINPNLL